MSRTARGHLVQCTTPTAIKAGSSSRLPETRWVQLFSVFRTQPGPIVPPSPIPPSGCKSNGPWRMRFSGWTAVPAHPSPPVGSMVRCYTNGD